MNPSCPVRMLVTLLSQCCSFPSHTGCVSTEEDSKLTCPLPIKEPNTCCCFLSQNKKASSSTPPYISITSQIILPLKQPFQPLIFLPESIWNMRLKHKHAAGGEHSLALVKMKPRGLPVRIYDISTSSELSSALRV